MRAVFAALLRRDLRLALRRPGDMAMIAAFFAAAVTLFPLGIGPDPATLARVAPGILWAAALFSAMLSLDRLFAADHGDGGLDLVLLAPVPLEAAVLAKCLAHWLTGCAPLVAMSPALAIALDLRGGALVPLLVLPLCMPVLIFGAAAADLAARGLSPSAPLMALGGLLLAALALGPRAAAAALRLAGE